MGKAPWTPGLLYEKEQPEDCHPPEKLEKAPSGVCGYSET